MTVEGRHAEVEALLHREALCLDEQRWDDWLALYTEDVEYWVPAWKSEHEQTADPRREISLIYLNSRARLEERIWRIRSGRSAANLVLPRTAHAISNVLIERETAETVDLRCLCVTHIYDPKRRTEYRTVARHALGLVRPGEDWRIRSKTVVVLNDNLRTKLDFYML